MKHVIARDSHIIGTYDDDTLRALLNAGTLKLTDHYWDDATSTWGTLTDFIGPGARARRFRPALARIAILMLAAGCGSVATWLTITRPDMTTIFNVPANPGGPSTAPPQITDQTPAAPVPTPVEHRAPATPTPPAPPVSPSQKTPTSALALLNVEVFDDEVAVTVQNNGEESVDGFDVRLNYFALPPETLRDKADEAEIAALESKSAERAARIKQASALATALEYHFKVVTTDVITWTPSHVKALPSEDEWKNFGDDKLAAVGAKLTRTARAFAAGASGTDPVARNRALTEVLLDLARCTEDARPLIEKALASQGAERDRLYAEQKRADTAISTLKQKRADSAPLVGNATGLAQSKPLRTEVVHISGSIEPGLVQRIAVRRQPGKGEGVVAELVRPDEKTVALSHPP